MGNWGSSSWLFSMIGRADIEGSKSNVAMNAWLPQASYPSYPVVTFLTPLAEHFSDLKDSHQHLPWETPVAPDTDATRPARPGDAHLGASSVVCARSRRATDRDPKATGCRPAELGGAKQGEPPGAPAPPMVIVAQT
eukprot:Skav206773  [mRNA]  locus=scaffold1823:42487:42897:+ [translate_table: standard]